MSSEEEEVEPPQSEANENQTVAKRPNQMFMSSDEDEPGKNKKTNV